MSILWRPDLSIGIDSIDYQHKELINRANDLFEACKQGQGPDKIKDMIDYLKDYMSQHFKEEEALQIKLNYSKYIPHKNQHDVLSIKFNQLSDEFNENQSADFILLNINRLLLDWIVYHICVSDRLFGNFLKANGLVEHAS